jgi:hypothetical protein
LTDIVDTPDWSRIPPPVDDGAVRHLWGLPPVSLQATNGERVNLSVCRGRSVVYIYPRTGRPWVPSPDGWDMTPGPRVRAAVVRVQRSLR